jgi:glycosyltransferase involved in cell wall biosynthesis
MNTSPIISVVMPTYNRADLLRDTLQSFAAQTMDVDDYEVVVIDDGSTDDTAGVCKNFSSKMRVKYFRMGHVGTASVKNLGIFACSGVLILFFDDDDTASEDLLWEHVRAHQSHPQEHIAILGYTAWAPSLPVSEVMHYLTDIGQYLFSYRNLHDGQLLDFHHFWTGRISCKRKFLARNHVFDQSLDVYEDVELGYRLSLHGLQILFHRNAVSHMNRPLTYDMFCRRCEGQGTSLWRLSRLHADPVIQEYCGVEGVEGRWQDVRDMLDGNVRRVHELQQDLLTITDDVSRELVLDELHNLYRETFDAFRVKGIWEATRQHVPDATTVG